MGMPDCWAKICASWGTDCSTEACAKCVDQQVLREAVTHGGIHVEHALGRIGVPVVHGSGVVGQALGEVPLGAVGILDSFPENIVAKRSIGVSAPEPFQP